MTPAPLPPYLRYAAGQEILPRERWGRRFARACRVLIRATDRPRLLVWQPVSKNDPARDPAGTCGLLLCDGDGDDDDDKWRILHLGFNGVGRLRVRMLAVYHHLIDQWFGRPVAAFAHPMETLLISRR